MLVGLHALPEFARRFAASLPSARGERACIVGLAGELGAGKTAFVQEVAKALGVARTPVSPTFVVLRTYPLPRGAFRRLVHVDAYRLSPRGRDTVGWREYAANPENLILAEWPGRLPGGAPEGLRLLSFTVVGENVRDISDTHDTH